VAASTALGLDADQVAAALSLAVPAAGGVQRAFGTAAKSLQVGFAAEAGLRAARLAGAGADADPRALEDWLALVGGDPEALELDGEAVPDGLALKPYPCCYALQRPIAAVAELGALETERVCAVLVRTPASALKPLLHHAPRTGLEAKFSLEYGMAAALLDGDPGIESFSADAVARPEARRLMERVEVTALDGGEGLLSGRVEIEVRLDTGEPVHAQLELPPGAPARPFSAAELERKLEMCGADELRSLTWQSASAQVV
jgi:2-methylcitrate dehydratase PrpD